MAGTPACPKSIQQIKVVHIALRESKGWLFCKSRAFGIWLSCLTESYEACCYMDATTHVQPVVTGHSRISIQAFSHVVACTSCCANRWHSDQLYRHQWLLISSNIRSISQQQKRDNWWNTSLESFVVRVDIFCVTCVTLCESVLYTSVPTKLTTEFDGTILHTCIYSV